ncbi:MAG: hypothetical protein JO056_09345 [Alphaproteobacteria bacterium]|nr:hypothetical protein [Alphaproteobacteria bacterium]
MIHTAHWSRVEWDSARWPHFTPRELSCHCCGEMHVDAQALDALERLRRLLEGPVTVASGHRCARHNAEVGGAAHSVHLQLAFDIALGPHARRPLLNAAREAGFLRFGLMRHALHCDTHPVDAHHAALWTYGPESRRLWAGLFPPATPDIST